MGILRVHGHRGLRVCDSNLLSEVSARWLLTRAIHRAYGIRIYHLLARISGQ